MTNQEAIRALKVKKIAYLNKVIKGLECHKNRMVCMNHCPYADGSGCQEDCTDHLISDAYEVLKKKKAVKPKMNGGYMCGNCGQALVPYAPFCHSCGSEVKW